jgi:ketopantoate reductase
MVRGGENVLFVDTDRDHVRAMQEHGLTIRGFAETFTVPVQATTPDALSDQLETVLLAVKAPATEAAVSSFADRLAPDGCVVSLQNGLNELTIARLVGEQRTIGAFVNFSADYLEPGLIHLAGRGAFSIGELDGSTTPRILELQRALGHWGTVQVTDNIWGFLWGKQAYGAMLFATALTNDSMADAIDAHRGVMVALASEVLQVAKALWVTPLAFDGFDPEAIGSGDSNRVNATRWKTAGASSVARIWTSSRLSRSRRTHVSRGDGSTTKFTWTTRRPPRRTTDRRPVQGRARVCGARPSAVRPQVVEVGLQSVEPFRLVRTYPALCCFGQFAEKPLQQPVCVRSTALPGS